MAPSLRRALPLLLAVAIVVAGLGLELVLGPKLLPSRTVTLWRNRVLTRTVTVTQHVTQTLATTVTRTATVPTTVTAIETRTATTTLLRTVTATTTRYVTHTALLPVTVTATTTVYPQPPSVDVTSVGFEVDEEGRPVLVMRTYVSYGCVEVRITTPLNEERRLFVCGAERVEVPVGPAQTTPLLGTYTAVFYWFTGPVLRREVGVWDYNVSVSVSGRTVKIANGGPVPVFVYALSYTLENGASGIYQPRKPIPVPPGSSISVALNTGTSIAHVRVITKLANGELLIVAEA